MAVNKGVFFSLDAIIAATIILIGLMLATSFYISEGPTTHLNYLAGDLIKVLSELNVSEADNPYVSYLRANGSITRLDNSILEQIGEFWAEKNIVEAANLTKEFVNDYIDSSYGYNITINDEEIYSKASNGIKMLISSQKMISGIMKNRTREGYNARATASKIKKNMTDIYVFESEGSGNEAGADKRVEITKKFRIDSDTVYKGMLYLAIHYGTAVMNPQTEFIVNGYSMDNNDINWSYVDYDKDNTHLAFGKVEITEHLYENDWNEVKLILFGQAAYHTHLHPGGRVEINYESDKMSNVSKITKKRVYFDHILSKGKANDGKSGAWAIQPILVPKYVTIKSAKLHINGISISNDAGKDNIQIYLDNKTLELADPDADGIFEKTYDLKDNLTEGTNVISVYLNSYPDDFWGDGDTILYSDPKNAPDTSSYVEVEYEFEEGDKRLIYGKIDVTAADEFGGTKSNSKVYAKDFTGDDIYEAFIQPAQLDSRDVSVAVNSQQIFKTPRALAVPSSVYVDSNYLINGINYFDITDSCLDCDVLPDSLLYYTLYVPSFVTYGSTFDTEQEARDDAIERLEAVLGQYVEAVEINDKIMVLGKVPSMWGPAITEVRVWQ